MPLLGPAAIAMWWTITPDMRDEFEHWHSHEHFPERMAIAGFHRGSRWAAASQPHGTDFFVLYELQDYAVLTSTGYRQSLDNPTPWSRRLMPHHRQMVRSQCRVLASHGEGLGGQLLTVRLSPAPGQAGALQAQLEPLLAALPRQPGLTAAHLLRTDTPIAEATIEQRIRGGDAVADWVLLVGGYDAAALGQLRDAALADAALQTLGAAPGSIIGLHGLRHADSARAG